MHFRASRLDDSWKAIRRAAQERQLKNDAPHLLSRWGYALLEERMKKARADASGLESADLVDPPPRYELWKAARTRSDGQMTSQSARVIAERIVSQIIHTIYQFEVIYA
ncbi:hypothetical protein Fmac_024811 [Flemingia macrophylla]|uniref:Uncharacterized protein n=1 Tax=Flemingia macrophylla TaxID=520843 RepID=A0ABD1LQE6_9FABA